MTIKVHRGTNQIGGSIIEIATSCTRIFFDIGINLEEKETVIVPKIEGLFYGKRNCDGVFISHYHSDHIGLLPNLLPNIPIYMGEKAYHIYVSAASYRGVNVSFAPIFLYDANKVQIGDIGITPICCDHSAYDSYMFLIEADGKIVLYTGDFRANGRSDFEVLLSALPEVDVIIIEGTTLSHETFEQNIEEEKLEEIASNYIKKHAGPAFIMMSAMNIDRLITAYHAAQSTHRLFLEDIYTAEIASVAHKDILAPNKDKQIRGFTTGGDKKNEKLQHYGNAKIGKYEISKKPFIMCVRQSMKNYLAKLNELLSFEDGVLFYAMWKGYMKQPEMQDFIRFMQGKGVKLHILHTSGHADALTIDKLIEATNAKIIIPVHTENAEWFKRYSQSKKISNGELVI